MLKKNDLVKQFELVVKQEIINHNDAILASNILVNKLFEEVQELKKAHSREVVDLRNEISNLEIHLSQISHLDRDHKHHKKCTEEYLCRIKDDHFHSFKQVDGKFAEHLTDLKKAFLEISHHHRLILQAQQDIVANEKQSKLALDRVVADFNIKLKNLKREFLELPSKECENVRELEIGCEQNRFSVKCLYEEMESHKEKRFYNDKQIEHLFTLVDRLKKVEK